MEGSAGTSEWDSNPKGYRGRHLCGTGQIVVGIVFVMTFVVHAVTYGTIDNQLGNFLFGFFIISTGIMGSARKPRISEIFAYMVSSMATVGVCGYLLLTSVMNLITLIQINEIDDSTITSDVVNWIVYVLGIIFSIVGTVFASLIFCD